MNDNANPPATNPDDHHLEGLISDEALVRYESWLDSHFSIFGFRFGLDGLIGLIPGIGDLTTTGISTIFVADAIKIGARKFTIGRMIANIGIDFALGFIPLVGDLFDFAFKSNTKNLRILREEREHLRARAMIGHEAPGRELETDDFDQLPPAR